MRQHGYLEGSDMATTFNMLRANDLIWSFVVNNYLLGKEPFPFDLLYWNSDSTRMPAAMHSFYLRTMYQENKLVVPGALTLAGVPIDLRRIKTPSFILSAREDHIAPWKSTYAATQLYQGPVQLRARRLGPHRRRRQSAGPGEIRPLDQSEAAEAAGRLARRRRIPRGLVVADLGEMGGAPWRRSGPGAPARRRQAQADRGRARLLRAHARELIGRPITIHDRRASENGPRFGSRFRTFSPATV